MTMRYRYRMRLLPLLLRLLLSTLLVLDGTASAIAMTHMPLAHAAHAGSVRHSEANVATHPCPQAMAGMATHGTHAAVTRQAGHGSAQHDCCHAGDCGYACAGVAAVGIAALSTQVLPAAAALSSADSGGHRPPVLSHLIRPPIG